MTHNCHQRPQQPSSTTETRRSTSTTISATDQSTTKTAASQAQTFRNSQLQKIIMTVSRQNVVVAAIVALATSFFTISLSSTRGRLMCHGYTFIRHNYNTCRYRRPRRLPRYGQRTTSKQTCLSMTDGSSSISRNDKDESTSEGSQAAVTQDEDEVKGSTRVASTETAFSSVNNSDKSKTGDPFRAASGNRPSLHPITINAVADALKKRSQQQIKTSRSDGDEQDSPQQQKYNFSFRTSDTVAPIDVAITAGSIASAAIAKRRQEQDATNEDARLKLTEKEEQTVAGRILGVIMRLDELEELLWNRVSNADWVSQYDEWTNFGVLEAEGQQQQKAKRQSVVDQRIVDDPLFCLNRAECLLALFLDTVEAPQLAQAGETVPDNSKIDFIDSDRLEVILQR